MKLKNSGDGSMELLLPADFAADLDAHAGDGAISLGMPVVVSGALSRSRIQGALNGGGPLLRLWSGDGSIQIDAAR